LLDMCIVLRSLLTQLFMYLQGCNYSHCSRWHRNIFIWFC